jgi:hypothetical protein
MSHPAKATKKYDHDYLKAGQFLAAHVAPNVKILADPVSYIPPKFYRVRFEWELYGDKVKEFQPEIIVLNRRVTGGRSWKKKGTKFKDMQFRKGIYDHWERYNKFLIELFSPGSGWNAIYETENIVILKKGSR